MQISYLGPAQLCTGPPTAVQALIMSDPVTWWQCRRERQRWRRWRRGRRHEIPNAMDTAAPGATAVPEPWEADLEWCGSACTQSSVEWLPLPVVNGRIATRKAAPKFRRGLPCRNHRQRQTLPSASIELQRPNVAGLLNLGQAAAAVDTSCIAKLLRRNRRLARFSFHCKLLRHVPPNTQPLCVQALAQRAPAARM